MMLNLFSSVSEDSFYPLTFTRPISALRMGALTFAERWEKLLNHSANHYINNYLKEFFFKPIKGEHFFINVIFFPTEDLVEVISSLKNNECIFHNQQLVAFKGEEKDFLNKNFSKTINYDGDLMQITRPYHLFTLNKKAIEFDFHLITKNRKSAQISKTNQVVGDVNKIFIEEGANVECTSLNTREGYIYIGKDAEVMEGSLLRGPIIVCEGAKVKLGAKIYGETTIGPYSKVAGELNKCVILGYSNKAHEGYLGCSVVGEWCNLGADTNSSNMKNSYGEVKIYNYASKEYESTGEIFCGVIMGDHVKTAINTQINTGTVIEPFANVFQTYFPPRKVRAFSWGGSGDVRYDFNKAIKVAEIAMKRRNVALQEEDVKLYHYLFDML